MGYAEYSVFTYKAIDGDFEKTYDIAKQKELYIKSLRQLIDDEITIDTEVRGEEKAKAGKVLNEIVDRLSQEITDVFYLRQAQNFHYSHYDYY